MSEAKKISELKTKLNAINKKEELLKESFFDIDTRRKPVFGPSEVISKEDEEKINAICSMMVKLKCDFRPGDIEPTPIMKDWWGFGSRTAGDCLGWTGVVQHPEDKRKLITIEYYGKAQSAIDAKAQPDYSKLSWYENEIEKTVKARPISHYNVNKRALENYLIDNGYSPE
jgi:hypothetical protein